MTLCRYFPTLCRLADTRRAGVCCRTEEATTTSTTAAPVLAPRCGEVSFSVETKDRDNVQFPGAKAYNIGCRLRFNKCIVTKHPPRKFETTQLSLRISNVQGWPGTVTPRASSWRGRRACEAASPGWRPWARSVAARWSSCAGARWSAASTCSPAHTVSRSVGTPDMLHVTYNIEHIKLLIVSACMYLHICCKLCEVSR